jgi:hypothetical protein
MGARAVVAALKPERAAVSISAPYAQGSDIASAYCFTGRYFSAALTHAIAQGSKTASDAASEAADAAGLLQTPPTVEQLRQILSPPAASALLGASPSGASLPEDDTPALSPRVATARAIIAAGVAAAAAAPTTAPALRRPAGVPAIAAASSGALLRSGAAATQYRSALLALVRFLRRRRCTVEDAWVSASRSSGSASSSTGVIGSSDVVKQRLSPQQLQAYLVSEPIGGRYFAPPCSAFEAAGRSISDLRGLRLAIDTALLRALLALGHDVWLARFVSHPVTLDLTDADAALRQAGRFSTLALLYARCAWFAESPTADAAAISALQVGA